MFCSLLTPTEAKRHILNLLHKGSEALNNDIKLYRGDDEASAFFVHLQLLQSDAELCEETQTEAVDGRTLQLQHGHTCRKTMIMRFKLTTNLIRNETIIYIFIYMMTAIIQTTLLQLFLWDITQLARLRPPAMRKEWLHFF